LSELGKFVALASSGVSLKDAIKWSELNLASDRAESVLIRDVMQLGAPISLVGRRLIDFEMDLLRFQNEVDQAAAVPLATRKLLLWLPALSLLLGQLAGFGTFAALITPVGLVALLISAMLIYLGVRWSGKMLSPLRGKREHPGFQLMRLSLALASGKPLVGLDPQLAAAAAGQISLSKQTGARLSELVDAEISISTALAQQKVMLQAKELGVKLLIPLSVTVLPAFLILTIVPMFIGIGFN
jgi:tight adherence protein B